ncbi:hypothetical protein ACIPJS_39150 [Streptomyces sp. NPDC086783]|uniref:hypothetical protein n=1 Tax=Streptomyces sp. NPDC086783 TaxID=3365758 RepID=UPI00380ED0CA
MPFHDYLQNLVETDLAIIPVTDAAEINAFSFLIDNGDDDPRLPTLTIGYNTEAQAVTAPRAPSTRKKPAGTTPSGSRTN